MAKRRRRKPNISQAVLNQAREGTAAPPSESAPNPEPPAKAAAPPRRRRALQATQLEKRRSENVLDAEYIAELLANPTKIVREEDLRAEYGFVIKDLRNMGILAAVLFAALIAVSLVLL